MDIDPAEVKRLQDHAFRLAIENGAISLAARRALRALDGYWGAYERDYEWERLWWDAWERWRHELEEALDVR